MKTSSLFKSLTTYRIAPMRPTVYRLLADSASVLDEDNDAFGHLISRDPEGSSELESIGFQTAYGLPEMFTDIQGSGVLFFIRYARRMVPAATIRARLRQKVEDYEDLTGRKPTKNERRDMREEAHAELLPRAFVRETIIPVIVTNDDWLFVFTSSQSKSEMCALFLLKALEVLNCTPVIGSVELKRELAGWMTSLAIGSGDDFQATDFAVMKGNDEALIRVKDRDLAYGEIQTAIKAGFRVEQVGLVHTMSGLRGRLSRTFVLTQVRFNEESLANVQDNTSDAAQELIGITWLVISEYRQMLSDLIADINEGIEDAEQDEGEW